MNRQIFILSNRHSNRTEIISEKCSSFEKQTLLENHVKCQILWYVSPSVCVYRTLLQHRAAVNSEINDGENEKNGKKNTQ